MENVDTRIAVDSKDLESRVKEMYRQVAENPHGEFHFEMGRSLAEQLGYASAELDRIPAEAIDSFAGVGHYFDLAAIAPGERVVDFGSGSGMDTFIAALRVGEDGKVVGIDMTEAQRVKAERLRDGSEFTNIDYLQSYIEDVAIESASCDVVVSNGVFNLSPDKPAVFREAARILKTGGRLAIADIVTDVQLPENITCDATLWAACIGGAAQRDEYRSMIESAGLQVMVFRENPQYRFLSKSAQGATAQYGVRSVSVLAVKR